MKILVTGGGGFIGMALVKRLVEVGFEVSSFSRENYPEHRRIGVTSFQGDLRNLSEIENASRGVEAVFHVAAKVGIWGKYSDFYDTNVTGSENVINACKKNGVRKLIFTSSASVIFDGSNLEGVDESLRYPSKPLSNYTATKALAEQLALQANCESLRTISLRPHLVWGPGDTQLLSGILKRAKLGKLRKLGRKDFFVDITYIDNFIDASILALEALDKNPDCRGKAFFITNGEPILIWDFINSIIESAGMQMVKKTIPKNLALIIAWVLEKIHGVFQLKSEPFITQFVIRELCTHHWFNITASKAMLGYSPKIKFEEGIKRLMYIKKEKVV